MNTKEKIANLLEEQRSIEEKYHGKRALFMGVSATMNPARNEARVRHKQIDAEIRALATKEIADLKAEQAELEKKYPKFGKKLIYIFTGIPEEVSNAEKRYNVIRSEIDALEYQLRFR